MLKNLLAANIGSSWDFGSSEFDFDLCECRIVYTTLVGRTLILYCEFAEKSRAA